MVSNISLVPSHEEHAISFVGALKIPGVVEFALCLFFAKLVSYTFLYWLPTFIIETGELHDSFWNVSSDVQVSVLFDSLLPLSSRHLLMFEKLLSELCCGDIQRFRYDCNVTRRRWASYLNVKEVL